jgi:hypothetical protein
MRQREAMELSEPFRRLACDVLALDQPRMVIENGTIRFLRAPETEYLLGQIETLRQAVVQDFSDGNKVAK